MYIIILLTFIVFISLPVDILLAFKNLYMQLFVMMVIFITHELLHGIGFKIFGKIKNSHIVYGINLEKGVLSCSCKEEIDKKGIIGSLILPLIILTLVPIIIGLLFKVNSLILIALINLLGASLDILVLLDLLRLPSNIRYKDLDDTLGFILISRNNLSNYKYIGLKITKDGLYDNEHIKAKDYKKLTISKESILIIVIIIILLIISFML
jgi:hypothetical protein